MNSQQTVAGVSVKELAEEFGTPLYVYDQQVIEQRFQELSELGTVRFAVKACSNISVLSLLRKLGAVVDCVSVGELKRALAAGFDPKTEPPQVVYTCDIFDREALDFVVKHGIAVNAGSIDMLKQLGERGAKRDITVRINPGFGHGHSQKTNTGGPASKHGIWHEDIPLLLQAAKDSGLTISGVHVHIGSGTDLQHLSRVCDAMKEIVAAIGASVKMISAGGGFPIPYRESDEPLNLKAYGELWNAVRSDLQKELGQELQFEIEPGRYLVAQSGALISEIRAIKGMGENLYYLCDAGFNNLARPVMYGAFHRIGICKANGKDEFRTQQAIVAGPLCESGDVFTQKEGGFVESRELPIAEIGDYVVIHDAGAYGASMGSNYNSKPHCAEVLINNGQPKLIRRAQTVESLLELEMLTNG